MLEVVRNVFCFGIQGLAFVSIRKIFETLIPVVRLSQGDPQERLEDTTAA